MELLLSILLLGGLWIMCKIPEWKYVNRTCPPGKEIDYGKTAYDRHVNKISKQEFYRRYNSGYYDRDKKKY